MFPDEKRIVTLLYKQDWTECWRSKSFLLAFLVPERWSSVKTSVVDDKVLNNLVNDYGRYVCLRRKSEVVPAPSFFPNENDVLQRNCQLLRTQKKDGLTYQRNLQ